MTAPDRVTNWDDLPVVLGIAEVMAVTGIKDRHTVVELMTSRGFPELPRTVGFQRKHLVLKSALMHWLGER